MAALPTRGNNDWGFVIYRTVYTPESDALWPSILSKIDSYVAFAVWRYLRYDKTFDKSLKPSTFDYAAATPESAYFKNIVFSDAVKYANATLNTIRGHFADFLHTTPYSQKTGITEEVCLVIDEEMLLWIRDDTGVPMPHEVTRKDTAAVIAVDAGWDPEELEETVDPDFEGWALVRLSQLRGLHEVCDPDLTLGDCSTTQSPYYQYQGSNEGTVFSYKG